MKTVFNQQTRDELKARINSLSEKNTAQWGKMNIYQMLKHCTLWDAWILDGKNQKQVFIGRLFGKMALRGLLKDEQPMRRNSPTIPEFKIKEMTGDIQGEKEKWIALIEAYANYANPEFLHVFFGKMTKEEIGYLVYKHIDHHLRQFNG